jgi:hypothetical protein
MCFLSRRYRVSAVDNDGRVTGLDSVMLEYLYPASPPDAKPYATLRYREFMTATGNNHRQVVVAR